MGTSTKIATCCHCGSRTALTLAEGRHELSCASCGAPLRHLKRLPKEATAKRQPASRHKAVSHRPKVRQFGETEAAVAHKMRKPRKAKKRKSWLKEIFDVVEDIFD